ncbi:mycothiol transferase [Kitasatospora herbaricolor]|uniref:DinB family protein n=1 Tax=Kitasatospora herbaricolor TaxID=68217 RepID=A0ABZ1WHY1_9ACTN|nr:DinB family protein [Kitasatospora herbaricolor]
MNCAGLLADAFGRIRTAVHDVVEGLDADALELRLDEGANSIAWLVWHLTRIQDDHIADVAGTEQVWTAQGWADRFALPFPARATGYGHTAREVALVRVPSGGLLTGYHDAVHERTLAFVGTLTGAALDRVVDEGWTPPVTLGVRLVSVVSDDLQHIGQAAFVRGALLRR